MNKKNKQKLITSDILKQSVVGSFVKLDPRYMIKNPVMFVVEVGFVITLVLSFVPDLFGDIGSNLRAYNIIVSFVLFITLALIIIIKVLIAVYTVTIWYHLI